jgi:hypothetical protein
MARKGRTTNRTAPDGYIGIDKNLARELYEKGIEITIAGNNVNAYHIFDGWHLGCTPSKEAMQETAFTAYLNAFMFSLEPELGTYPVFYALIETVNGAPVGCGGNNENNAHR